MKPTFNVGTGKKSETAFIIAGLQVKTSAKLYHGFDHVHKEPEFTHLSIIACCES